jgi:hypothetical protein
MKSTSLHPALLRSALAEPGIIISFANRFFSFRYAARLLVLCVDRKGYFGIGCHPDGGYIQLYLSRQAELLPVEKSGAWCEQYSDKTAFIFSRCEPFP